MPSHSVAFTVMGPQMKRWYEKPKSILAKPKRGPNFTPKRKKK